MSAFKSASKILALTAVAVTTVAAVSAIGSAKAEAHHRHIHLGLFHHAHVLRPRIVVPLLVTGYVGGCYWLKVKAVDTGSPYWWGRYAACRGF